MAFIYLVLNVPDEKALAEKLGSATPTTLILVNRAGKVTEIKKGLQEKEIISGKVSALLK